MIRSIVRTKVIPFRIVVSTPGDTICNPLLLVVVNFNRYCSLFSFVKKIVIPNLCDFQHVSMYFVDILLILFLICICLLGYLCYRTVVVLPGDSWVCCCKDCVWGSCLDNHLNTNVLIWYSLTAGEEVSRQNNFMVVALNWVFDFIE